jgi:hemoglobin-like flavoprotein
MAVRLKHGIARRRDMRAAPDNFCNVTRILWPREPVRSLRGFGCATDDPSAAAATGRSPLKKETRSMTPHQIDLVQSSFAKVTPIADTAAVIFYDRLFEIAPEVRPLFHGDMAEQRRKLMTTLGVVVNGLKNLDAVLPAARALAVRHVGYGVKASYYTPVGEALIFALDRGLGPDFTDEVRNAWLAAYGALSSVMIAAAYEKEDAA